MFRMPIFPLSALVPARALALTALAALTACASGNSAGPGMTDLSGIEVPARAASADSAQTGAALLAVSNATGSNVTIYSTTSGNPRPIRTLTKGLWNPQGMTVDARGYLYVSDAVWNWIDEYKPGATSPSARLNTPKGYCPVDVAAGPNGYVYAAVENCTQLPTFVGRLLVFQTGKTKPTDVIKTPGEIPNSVAVDHDGNVYLGEMDEKPPKASHILRFPSGSSHGTDIGITDVAFVGGLAFDSKDNLYVVDRANSVINEYAKGSKTPKATISSGLSFPDCIVIDSNDTLYVSNVNDGNVLAFKANAKSPFKSFSIGMERPEGVTLLHSWAPSLAKE